MTDVNLLVTQHLDIWTAATKKKSSAGRGNGGSVNLYGVKKLRELILELAVRGKLVPQKEGSANSLLKELERGKASLVSKGEIRKPRQVEHQEAQERHRIPPGWLWVHLDQVGAIVGGGTPKASDPDNFEEPGKGLPWLTPADLSGYSKNFIERGARDLSQKGLAKSSATAMPKDTVLFTSRAPIGYVAISTGPVATNQGFKSVVPFVPEMSRYITMVLRCFAPEINAAASGTTFKEVSGKIVAGILFPLPPLAEQHRIVAKVDELMMLCDALEAQAEDSLKAHQTLVETCLATLTNSQSPEELTQNWTRIEAHFDTLFTTEESINLLEKSILELGVSGRLVPQKRNESSESFSKQILDRKSELLKRNEAIKPKKLPSLQDEFVPTSVPEGWAFFRLQDLIVKMDAGWSPACPPEPSPSDELWGVLKTTAVQPMLYWEHQNKMLPDELMPREQYEVRAGDILITRAGPKNRVAICCAVEETRPRLMISDKIIRFHMLDIGVLPRFVAMSLNVGNAAGYLDESKSGMAESQMNISQDKLKGSPILLPPIQEQRLIVKEVDRLLSICRELRKVMPVADQLSISIADNITSKIH